MRTFSWLERKGVCLGLLWGILSAGKWPVSTVGTRCVQAPFVVFDYLWITYKLPARAQLPYVLAIMFSTCVVYVISYVVYLWGRRVSARSRRSTASLAKRRTTRRY
jgi:hypothetical protein